MEGQIGNRFAYKLIPHQGMYIIRQSHQGFVRYNQSDASTIRHAADEHTESSLLLQVRREFSSSLDAQVQCQAQALPGLTGTARIVPVFRARTNLNHWSDVQVCPEHPFPVISSFSSCFPKCHYADYELKLRFQRNYSFPLIINTADEEYKLETGDYMNSEST